METAPIYAFFADQTEFAKPDIPGAAVAGPRLLSFNCENQLTRKRLLSLLTFTYGEPGNQIHAGTLFAAGALAGAAARASAEYRGAEDIARSAGLEDILSTPDGPWALKELAIWQMVRSLLPGSLSIWRIILGGIIHDGVNEIPDIDALCTATMNRRGTEEWGLPFFNPAYCEDAFSSALKLWPVARFILKEEIKKGTAAVEIASVAQMLLTITKNSIVPYVGACLVMQAAVITATDGSLAEQIAEIGLLPGKAAPGPTDSAEHRIT